MRSDLELYQINLKDLSELADNLAKQIKTDNLVFDHILYIERAGKLIGYLLHSRLGGNISGIRIGRPGSKIKSLLAPLLGSLPNGFRNILRNIELRFWGMISYRQVVAKDTLPQAESSVLIVDDACDSGRTINEAINLLLEQGLSLDRIRIAVITTTLNYSDVHPDYFCFLGRKISFPWSTDSIEYNLYNKIYKKIPDSSIDKLLINI